MSSFNNIYKVKYEKNTPDPVSLKEYIVFEDERTEEKYLVFKFKNNLNQSLNSIRVEISVMDAQENIVEKLTMSYDDFSAYDNEDFVPNAKLKVDPLCKSISARLIYAKFERCEWENGEYTVIPYTAKDFTKDFSKKKNKEEKPVKEKQVKTKKSKRKIRIKSIYKKNIAKAGKVWGIIFGIVAIAYVVASTILYSLTIGIFSVGDFDFQPLGDSENCALISYVGNDDTVVIPGTAKNLKVSQISNKAFEGKNLTTVQFDSEKIALDKSSFANSKLTTIVHPEAVTVICDNAFENTQLTKVEFENATYIQSNAFKNSSNLTEVKAPKASISSNAFMGTNLKTLIYKDSETVAFYQMINAQDMNSATSVNKVECGRKSIPNGYFVNCSQLSDLTFTNSPTFEYGALKGTIAAGYVLTDEMEILNNEIISVASKNVLVLSSYVPKFEDAVANINPTEVTTLVIRDPKYKVDGVMLSSFPNLTEIKIDSLSSISELTPIQNTTVRTLTAPITADYSKYFSTGFLSHINKLNLTGTNGITASALENFISVTELKLLGDVAYVEENAFQNMYNLKKLEMYLTSKTFAEMGVSKTLTEATITANRYTASPAHMIEDYPNLEKFTLGGKYISIGTMLINQCPKLKQLEIPTSVQRMEESVIGTGCDLLYTVKTPFVGKSASIGSSYKEFNQSAWCTMYLTITEKSTLASTFSTGLYNLISLVLPKEMNLVVNSLSGLKRLSYLEIHTYSLENITRAIGDTPLDTLKTLVLYCSGVVDLSLLKGTNVSEVFVFSAARISVEKFADTNIQKLYVDSSVDVSQIKWEQALSKYSVMLLFQGTRPENLENYYNFRESVEKSELEKLSSNYKTYRYQY